MALTYRSAVDDPAHFTFSKKVGPWVGLTPSRNQSGERDVSGGITKAGDVSPRGALCHGCHRHDSPEAIEIAEKLGGAGCRAAGPSGR
ncbi:transposase [Paracoccus benzoatiresistens]|uniref:Transposase n=1 Tax=Paracoccus benzoatiresistens TaxID=2997341 RepID=A0ABT4JAB4_9RHOB|nr:transposase [Paracoccus sp. EF6]MCZ0964072.1 transposase [Paracoccus sp. EF6]